MDSERGRIAGELAPDGYHDARGNDLRRPKLIPLDLRRLVAVAYRDDAGILDVQPRIVRSTIPDGVALEFRPEASTDRRQECASQGSHQRAPLSDRSSGYFFLINVDQRPDAARRPRQNPLTPLDRVPRLPTSAAL